jgi:uncharacterized RDD family membrane protein YckC
MCDKSTPDIPVSLFKRLMAIVYDLLLLTALLFTVGILVSTILTFALNEGNAITDTHPYYLEFQLFILCTLFFSSFLFFSWFWMHGGQTLGMKTWRVQLISVDDSAIGWKESALRFMGAIISWLIFGLGFIWVLFDKENRTWHDIFSGTKLVQLEKK